MSNPPTEPGTNSVVVHCPRCGYDLRGETLTWRRACPMDGRCIECGLDFRWSTLFMESRHPWLFESRWRYRPLHRLASTVRYAMRPRRFWHDVRITEPFRLLVPLLLVVIPACLLFAATSVLAAAMHYRQVAPRWRRTWVWSDRLLDAAGDTARNLVVELPAPLIMLLGMPLVFLVIPATLRQARVRKSHVVRIWLYSLLLPLIVTAGLIAFWTVAALADAGWIARGIDPWSWAARIPPDDRLIPYVLRRSSPSILPGLLLTAWLGWWWCCACRSYLRLEQWKLIVMTLLGVLWFASFVAEFWVRYG